MVCFLKHYTSFRHCNTLLVIYIGQETLTESAFLKHQTYSLSLFYNESIVLISQGPLLQFFSFRLKSPEWL